MTSTIRLNQNLLETMLGCSTIVGKQGSPTLLFAFCSSIAVNGNATVAANTTQIVSGISPYFLQRKIDNPTAGDVTLDTLMSFKYNSTTPATATHLAAFYNGKLLFYTPLTASIVLDASTQTNYLVSVSFTAHSI